MLLLNLILVRLSRTFFTSRALSLLLLFLFVQSPLALIAQTSSPSPQGMGGVSTGTAATYTSRRTADIVDAKAPVIFEDVAEQTGVGKFKHHSGSAAKDYIIDTPSGGCAIFDYDSDGRADIYLLNGSTIAAMQGK